MTFSPDGRWIATSDDDHALWLYRLEDIPITAIEFSPDGKLLAVRDRRGLIRLWDSNNVSSSPLRLHLQGFTWTGLTFSPDGRWLAGGDALGTWLWRLDLQDIIHRTCLIVRRNLTCEEWVSSYSSDAYHQTCTQFPIPTCP